MKNIHSYTSMFLFLLFGFPAFSQNILSGKITDNISHASLNGASVYIPDLKLGAVTDADGKYTIKNVPRGTFLVVEIGRAHV